MDKLTIVLLLSLFGSLIFYGCKDSKLVLGDYYYQFDRLDYYHIDISEEDTYELEDNMVRSSLEEQKLSILTFGSPETIDDTLFIKELPMMGFEMKSFTHTSDVDSLKEIFREKTLPSENYAEAACAPIFRDILIFRSGGKIEGMAKICLDCWQEVFLGTEVNTNSFGEHSGDYKRLYRLLYAEREE
ncbi:MAG: hypothetical protein AAF655_22945 [Bacteroidota bacterium]